MEKLATIDIRGKAYVTVAERVRYFNEAYPNGMIETVVTYLDEIGIVRAQTKVTPDVEKPNRYFIGHSEENRTSSLVNKTSATENCETSSVGRALGLMGIGVLEGIASADEVNKAVNAENAAKTLPGQPRALQAQDNGKKCAKCNANIAVSKSTGKEYCSARCWVAPVTAAKLSEPTLDEIPF